MEDNEARVNFDWKGNNYDLPDPVLYDASDAVIRGMVTEAVRGGLGGHAPDPTADFADFVLDRREPTEQRAYRLIQLRPKTPFGGQTQPNLPAPNPPAPNPPAPDPTPLSYAELRTAHVNFTAQLLAVEKRLAQTREQIEADVEDKYLPFIAHVVEYRMRSALGGGRKNLMQVTEHHFRLKDDSKQYVLTVGENWCSTIFELGVAEDDRPAEVRALAPGFLDVEEGVDPVAKLKTVALPDAVAYIYGRD